MSIDDMFKNIKGRINKIYEGKVHHNQYPQFVNKPKTKLKSKAKELFNYHKNKQTVKEPPKQLPAKEVAPKDRYKRAPKKEVIKENKTDMVPLTEEQLQSIPEWVSRTKKAIQESTGFEKKKLERKLELIHGIDKWAVRRN